MKKTILGLVLSVGCMGFAVANTVDLENESIAGNKEISVYQLEIDSYILSCTNRYVQRWVGCDGSFHDVTTAIVEGGDCGGAPNGTYRVRFMSIDGCPQGPE